MYIDDILVWSSTWEEHLLHLRRVFEQLEAAALTCQVKKCDFGKAKLKFLGHKIGGGRMCDPENRITSLREYEKPMTRKKLRTFLGTIN